MEPRRVGSLHAYIMCQKKKYNLLPFASLGGYKRETLILNSFSIVAWDVQYVTH